jgi:hypothetical protein
MMNLEAWLQEMGFVFHPFRHLAADDTHEGDPHLADYFVEFPYYDEIKQPGTIFLFTRRGGGKSANRLMLEIYCQETLASPTVEPRILAVRYVDFGPLLEGYPETRPSLEQHVEAILQAAVPRLFDAAIRHLPDALDDLDRFQKEDLIGFLSRYSDCLTERGLHQQLERIGVPSEARKRISWEALKEGAAAAVSLIGGGPAQAFQKALGALGQLAVGSAGQPEELPKTLPSASPMGRIERFTRLTRAMGIDDVYVLVDRTDELPLTAEKPEAVADLLRELALNLPLLTALSFKFFLPIEIDLPRHLGSAFRRDRLAMRSAEWKPADLHHLLERRLDEASEGRISSFSQLVHFSDPTRPRDVDAWLVRLAHGSPRDLIHLGSRIFARHLRMPTSQLLIEEQTARESVGEFAKERSEQLYAPGDLEMLRQIGWGVFLPKEAAKRLRVYMREARERIRDLESRRVVVCTTAPTALWQDRHAHGLTDDQVKAAFQRWQEQGWITMGGENNANPQDTLEVFVIPDPRVRYLVNPDEMKGGGLE